MLFQLGWFGCVLGAANGYAREGAIAAPADGAWTVFAPVVMTVMLLRVSGVTLLEKDIGERRPEYHDYVRRTNAFFPGPRNLA